MKLSLKYPKSNKGIIDLGKVYVDPFSFVFMDELRYVDYFRLAEFLCHDSTPVRPLHGMTLEYSFAGKESTREMDAIPALV